MSFGIFSRRLTYNKKGIVNFLVLTFAPAIILTTTAWASGSLTITPSTNLVNGQTVSVTGTGLAKSATGSIVQCNSDPSQPTIMVAGNPVPVSCSNPLSTLVTTTSTGTVSSHFVVKTGTVGPPASGTDSAGGNAATDAAKYPCPPTSTQTAAGVTCNITFGDANGDDVIHNISFASKTPTTPPTTPSQSTTSPTNTSTSQQLTNTGPGNVIGLFIVSLVMASLIHYSYHSYRRKNQTNN